MTVAPRAGPAPRNRCPAQIAVRLRARDDEYGNVTGTRTTEENACRLGAQDLAAFRSDPCGSTARRRNPRYPAGLNRRRLWETWRTLLWARSIENLALAASNQNMVEPGGRGLAFVAAPEGVPVRSTVARMAVVDVGLDRIPRKKRLSISHGRNTMAERARADRPARPAQPLQNSQASCPRNFAASFRY
jgi:hypothetical protein